MHRVSRKVVLAAVGALALATLVAPAGAHNGKGGGKKPMGTIASFDGTSLTVTTADEDVTATVTDDTKVKVEHRGHHARGKGHGNPSRGDAEDLTAGTFVLDMKVDDDGNLDRIRVRSAAPHDPDPRATPTPTETPTPTPTETPTPTA
jgi:hypothetical protein